MFLWRNKKNIATSTFLLNIASLQQNKTGHGRWIMDCNSDKTLTEIMLGQTELRPLILSMLGENLSRGHCEMLSMLGKNLNRQHCETFFLVSLQNRL